RVLDSAPQAADQAPARAAVRGRAARAAGREIPVTRRHDRALVMVGAGGVALAAGLLVLLLFSKHHGVAEERAARQKEAADGPNVVVARVHRSPPERVLHLQGEARPFAQVTLYAKVSGYLGEVRVDKGDRLR